MSMNFTNENGRTIDENAVLEIFNRGAAELHASDDGVRKVGRSVAQAVEEGRWVGELFSIRRISHHPTWMGGNRDLCITADDGAQLWLRWDDAADAYRILKGGRPGPARRGELIIRIPQTEADFLKIEEEWRTREAQG